MIRGICEKVKQILGGGGENNYELRITNYEFWFRPGGRGILIFFAFGVEGGMRVLELLSLAKVATAWAQPILRGFAFGFSGVVFYAGLWPLPPTAGVGG